MTGPLAQQFAQVERGFFVAKDAWVSGRMADDGSVPVEMSADEFNAAMSESRAALSAIERHVQDMGLQAFEALRDVEALAENGKLAWGLDEAEALFEEIRDRALAALPAREKGEE